MNALAELPLFEHAAKYPRIPGYKTDSPETSKAAASHVRRARTILLERIKALLLREDLTADECADRMGESVLSVRPRFSELRRMGKITDTGTRRKNNSGHSAAVWRITCS